MTYISKFIFSLSSALNSINSISIIDLVKYKNKLVETSSNIQANKS